MKCVGGLDEPEYCNKGTRWNNEEQYCEDCPIGFYNDGNNESINCEVCPAGYFCIGGTNTAKPVNVGSDKGIECPPGYYCPEGIKFPISCPIGTYNAVYKGKSADDCLLCDSNTFQDKEA